MREDTTSLTIIIKPASTGEALCEMARSMGATAARNVWASTISGLPLEDCAALAELAREQGAEHVSYGYCKDGSWYRENGEFLWLASDFAA